MQQQWLQDDWLFAIAVDAGQLVICNNSGCRMTGYLQQQCVQDDYSKTSEIKYAGNKTYHNQLTN